MNNLSTNSVSCPFEILSERILSRLHDSIQQNTFNQLYQQRFRFQYFGFPSKTNQMKITSLEINFYCLVFIERSHILKQICRFYQQACLSMCGLNGYQTLKGYQKKLIRQLYSKLAINQSRFYCSLLAGICFLEKLASFKTLNLQIKKKRFYIDN